MTLESQKAELIARIPHDIWREILDHLRPGEQSLQECKLDVAKVALVCRSFCTIARPILFSELFFSGRGNPIRPPWSTEQHLEWASFIKGSSPIKSHVKSYTLLDWPSRGPDVLKATIDEHMHLLAHFPNLQSLRLSAVALAGWMLQSIQQLPKLETLSLEDCKFYHDVKDLVLPGPIACLRRYEHYGISSPPLGQSGEPYFSVVVKLISAPTLRVLKSCDWDLTSSFICSRNICPIEDLDVMVRSSTIDLFSHYLCRTPSIKALRISIFIPPTQYMDAPTINLEPSALPLLQEVQCPGDFLPMLVPGRHIRTVTVIQLNPLRKLDGRPIDVSPVKQSSAPIVELGVTDRAYQEMDMKDHFPHLETLTIYAIEKTRLDVKKEQLPVRNIRFHPATSSLFSRFTKSYSLDLQTQRQILDDFTKAFPSALCIQLADYVEWRRDSDSAWTWRPFVISRDRARSRLLLMARSLEEGYLQDLMWTKAVDEDGCLAGLFRPSEMTKSLSLILSSDENTTWRELQTRLANTVSPRLVGLEVERSDS
ncbi:hypothetical protein NEOLEDRAFT_1139804 [Neolentinus lepideus HHB14362 ss-1]|uniref:F-box domain-containing protein n=1 Tax=Neolentinus lepideus HHB14362 ss-1 TaxID=1314782 RepID=A0A165PKL2_9AGAM|nr:hypothetical protein NEOLEDRAFT_1139804 [Neolentinus lepideus HHB14362 ss-1]